VASGENQFDSDHAVRGTSIIVRVCRIKICAWCENVSIVLRAIFVQAMHRWHRSVSASLVVAAETTSTLSFCFEGQENLLDQNANAWGGWRGVV
jgi:hypothetical protein